MADHRPELDSQAWNRCSLVCFTAALACSAIEIAVHAASRVSQIEQIYAEMGASQYTLTVVVLSPWFAGLVPALVLAGFVKEVLVRDKSVTLWLNGLHIALLLVIAAVHWVGIALPMFGWPIGLE